MKELKIASGLSFPLDIVTQTIAILAKRRAGKSYTMRKMVEELLDNGQQVILVDPKGDQWGLRSSSDGKKPGFPIVILGGEHGDAPLEVNAGEVVAKLVVEERVSVLLDLSVFRKHEIATFMTAFLENLYRLKAKEEYRTPCTLVVDEADAIAPQKPQQNEARMLGAIEDIVRRGGQRGIGCYLITQRSAVLNKNVLTQAQMLIVLRTIAPQDLAAMKAWIEVHGTTEEGQEMMQSLPSLPIGDAYFWSPGWPTEAGIFKRVHILPIKTFDSGATPKPGERKIIPKTLADVDLESLKKQMASTIEKAKQENPKELKIKIKELELIIDSKNKIIGKSLGHAGVGKAVADALKDQQKQFDDEMSKRNEAYMMQVEGWLFTLNGLVKTISEFQRKSLMKRKIVFTTVEPMQKVDKTAYHVAHIGNGGSADANTPVEMSDGGGFALDGPERRIIDGVAWANSIGIDEPENSIVCFLAGYKNPSSAAYKSPRARLIAKGVVFYPAPGKVCLTDMGMKLASPQDGFGTEEDLHSKILERLTGPQKRILTPLLKEKGITFNNEELCSLAEYENPTSAAYKSPRGQLRSYGLIEYTQAGVKACDFLFLS